MSRPSDPTRVAASPTRVAASSYKIEDCPTDGLGERERAAIRRAVAAGAVRLSDLTVRRLTVLPGCGPPTAYRVLAWALTLELTGLSDSDDKVTCNLPHP